MTAKMRNDSRTPSEGIENEEKFENLLRKARDEGRLVEQWIVQSDPRYGSWILKGKLWIKVCNLHFYKIGADFISNYTE